jgi:SAM-dependent methyltransferase
MTAGPGRLPTLHTWPVTDPAGARWQKLVRARLGEMERLQPGRGALGADFWDGRAKRYASRLPVETATSDPFFRRLRRATGRRSTVLDVGSGPGRFTLALAPHVTCVQGRWEEVRVPPAHVAFSSFVVTLVADAPRFLGKLDAAATERAFLYLGAYTADAIMDPLWRHFHGRSRRPGPTYLDAVHVLRELGLAPEVEVVEVPTRGRFKTVAAAARSYREELCLPDTPEVRKELRGLLGHWLIRRDEHLAAPLKTVPAAIISWAPSGKGHGRN